MGIMGLNGIIVYYYWVIVFFDPLIIPNNNPMDKSYAVRIPWTSLTYIKKYAHLSILLGQESIGLIGKWSELRHTHTHTLILAGKTMIPCN